MDDIEQTKGKAKQFAGTVAHELKGTAGQLEDKAQQLQTELGMLVKHNLTSLIGASVVGAVVATAILGILARRRWRRGGAGS